VWADIALVMLVDIIEGSGRYLDRVLEVWSEVSCSSKIGFEVRCRMLSFTDRIVELWNRIVQNDDVQLNLIAKGRKTA
jgi:hypothetical protein